MKTLIEILMINLLYFKVSIGIFIFVIIEFNSVQVI